MTDVFNDTNSRRSFVNEALKKRSVWWFVETYLEEKDFQFALRKASHWAYIYHDKDINADGKTKVPHWHILLHYENARSGHSILRDFVGNANSFAEKPKSSPVACYEYLIHLNDPDKFQYDSSLIISHNPVYWEEFLPSVRDRPSADFIEDLLQEDLDLYYMAKKYGRDFMKNYKSYLDFRSECMYSIKFINSKR